MSLACTIVTAPPPLGALTVGVSERGLAHVSFGAARRRVAAAAAAAGLAVVAEPRRTAEAAAQLRAYLAGELREFTLALDWRFASAAARPVLEVLHAQVGYGRTVTYGELAARSGLGTGHTAARGVGAVMGANPLPVVVPCHRVLAAGGLGGFGGGRAVKEWLLALEGVLPPALALG